MIAPQHTEVALLAFTLTLLHHKICIRREAHRETFSSKVADKLKEQRTRESVHRLCLVSEGNMVLKKSKFNTNTGNTLRRVCGCSNKGIARSVKTDGYIVKDRTPRYTKEVQFTKDGQNPKFGHKKGKRHRKKFIQNEECDSGLDEGVPYSLNKNNRWLLASEIRENDYEDGDQRVALFAEKRGFYGYRGKRQKTWSNVHKRREHEDVSYTITNQPDTHGSFLTLSNAKWYNIEKKIFTDKRRQLEQRLKWEKDYYDYLGNDYDDYEKYYEDYYYQGIQQNDEQGHAETEDIFNENEYVYVPDDWEELSNSSADDESFVITPANGFSYNQMKNDQRSLGRSHSLLYDGDFGDILQQLGEKSDDKVDFEMHCLVNSNGIEGNYLESHLGVQFFEGNCEPRQLCIFDDKIITNGKYVALTEVRETKTNKTEVFIKAHKIPQNVAQFLGKQGFEQNFKLILDLCFNLDVLENYVNRAIPPSQKANEVTKSGSFDLISRDHIWLEILADSKCKSLAGNSTTQEETTSDKAATETFEFVSTSCAVCSSDDGMICIKSCGHSLCHDCWKGYIDNKISTNCTQIACPEVDCTEVLEPGFIVLQCSKDQAQMYIRKCVEAKVKETSSMQICPQENCDVIAVRKLHPPNMNNTVKCSCKFCWCFECLDQQHWPASCQAYKSQKHQTEGESHDPEGHLVQKYVVVKLCPGCKYPIEKFGGCDHMECMCGVTFCWRCCTRLREEAQQHKCNITHPMKFFFGNLNSIYSVTKSSIEWSGKADQFAELVKSVQIKTRRVGNEKFFKRITDSNVYKPEVHDAIDVLRQQSLSLLLNIYKLLQNISMETGHRDSRRLRLRAKIFMGNLKAELTESEKALDVYNPSSCNYIKTKSNLQNCLDRVTDFADMLYVHSTVL